MWKAWNCFLLLCVSFNTASMAIAWCNGEPAWWFVWVCAIWFSVDAGLQCILDLLEPSK